MVFHSCFIVSNDFRNSSSLVAPILMTSNLQKVILNYYLLLYFVLMFPFVYIDVNEHNIDL